MFIVSDTPSEDIRESLPLFKICSSELIVITVCVLFEVIVDAQRMMLGLFWAGLNFL